MWIVFYDYPTGTQVFGFYEYEEDAIDSYNRAVKEYKDMGIIVHVGIAEIKNSTLFD